MTCACESIHPFPCQFEGETEFFSFDGKEWCRFHLPLRDAAGNKSDKGRGKNGWKKGGAERTKFSAEIHARLGAATPWKGRNSGDDDTRAHLKGVAFPPGFDFSGICNEIHADFTRAIFGTIRFSRLKFGDYTSFNRATFGGRAFFEGATFGDRAYFTGATFGDWAYFEGATFGDWAGFRGAIFGGGAIFDNAAFDDSPNFAEAKFSGSVNFATSQEKNLRLERVNFSNAIFTGACKFDNRRFGPGVNFNGATFEDLAEFHGCEFHPGMSFHQTKFLKTKEDKLNTKKDNDDATERLERSYRTLKLEMEKLRARNEEADFFALEMECRRQRGSVPPFERFAATLYKHLSDYGRSVDLPLIWLLVLAYAAHYLYLGVAMIGCNPGPGARLAFTLEQMFRPFFVWDKGAPGTGNCLVENFPLLIPFLASLQSLGTIGLLTLFLLALRRRFKMD